MADSLVHQSTGARLDPFLFVAATRYAILRTLTGASEMVAVQVLAFAEHIKSEPGAASAILQEIEAARPTMLTPSGFGQSQYECEEIGRKWARAAEALS